MALDNPHVSSSIVEANEFPDLVARYAIEAVPKIIINDRVELLGAQPESAFVSQVVESVAAETTSEQSGEVDGSQP